MSNPTETIPVDLSLVAKKESKFKHYVLDPIKKHPKIATAIVAGAVLIGLAAVVADKDPYIAIEVGTDEDNDVEDTTVA